jgi:hypothetical protein
MVNIIINHSHCFDIFYSSVTKFVSYANLGHYIFGVIIWSTINPLLFPYDTLWVGYTIGSWEIGTQLIAIIMALFKMIRYIINSCISWLKQIYVNLKSGRYSNMKETTPSSV